MYGYIVRSLLPCAAAGRLAAVFLSPLQFGMQEFYSDICEVVIRGHLTVQDDNSRIIANCLVYL